MPIPGNSSTLAQIRFVLVGTSHPGNIGAAARAMKTMGAEALVLVDPQKFPDLEASARAAGADDILAAAQVVATLDEAIGDCRYVLGCSVRQRGVALPELSPRDAAPALVRAAGLGPVALLFGRERTGLTNDELQHCHAAVRIPANPVFSSLNLAAAVQVLAYELRLAQDTGCDRRLESRPRRDPPAAWEDIERLFDHLDRALIKIDFHKGRSPVTVMRRLRRLFLRAELDLREVRILHGILADAERMADLASGRLPGLAGPQIQDSRNDKG